MDAEHVFWQLTDINKRITRIENILELLPILLVAQAHPTHVSVESAATILGVSPKTVRRRIRRRELKLEVLIGTRRTGIPIEQLVEGWLDLRVAKAALARERAALQRKSEKR
jgi:DeoR/GlpR family transcriptional regulator of sugar metabolism